MWVFIFQIFPSSFQINAKLPSGKVKKKSAWFITRSKNLFELLQKKFRITPEEQRLGPKIVEINGEKSEFYHFNLVDRKTGERFIPYVIHNGVQTFLDLRHIKPGKWLKKYSLELEVTNKGCDFSNTGVERLDHIFGEKDILHYTIGWMDRKTSTPRKGPVSPLPRRMNFLLDKKTGAFPLLYFHSHAVKNFEPILTDFFRQKIGSQDDERFSGAISKYGSVPPVQEISRNCFCPDEFPSLPEPIHISHPEPETGVLQYNLSSAIPVSPAPAAKPVMPKNQRHIHSSKPAFSPAPGDISQRRGKGTKKPIALSSIRSFRAVIFDLDGVVVDSEKAHLITFNKALAPLGARIDEKTWRKSYTGIGSYAIMEDVFARNGIKENVHKWVQLRAGIYQKYIQTHGLPEIEGFAQVHSLLTKHGIKVAVGSGGHRPHIAESLRAIGVPKIRFVGLEDVKKRKPAPDTFLIAAKRIRAKPSECIVFEDSLAGIEAARAAGMPCIALSTTLSESKLQGKAALIVNNFKSKKLRNALAALLSLKAKANASKPKRRMRALKGLFRRR